MTDTEWTLMSSPAGSTYDEVRANFRWEIPRVFNIGVSCADAQRPTSPALLQVDSAGNATKVTFGDLTELSNRFANALRGLGIVAGSRVGIVLPPGLETGICHLAIYKLGAIAVPMSQLFGPDALGFRVADAGIRVVIAGSQCLDAVMEATSGWDVQVIESSDRLGASQTRFWDLVTAAAPAFRAHPTQAEDPALLIYTSGTTGQPKGALHAHRSLLGHLPGFGLMYDRFGRSDDRMWTPADWAWIGGLMDAVLPAWLHGRSVVSTTDRFDPESAVDLLRRTEVRNVFFPPRALRLMRDWDGDFSGVRLRSVMSGGESLGEELLNWAQVKLGTRVNEIYGQTEANLVVGNSQKIWPIRPGSMGRPFPGHAVAILDEEGSPLSAGRSGEIAVRRNDPVMFLGYWNQPDATARKFTGDWLLTGDVGTWDEDGYIWFGGREDDVISSSGYRIGPEEIEACLDLHPAVAASGVIGVPDPARGQAVKAYIQLVTGEEPSEALVAELQRHVSMRLAAHEYPRMIEFMGELPLTTTGKLKRAELRKRHAIRSKEDETSGIEIL